MQSKFQQAINLLNAHKTKVLSYAQLAVTEDKFPLLRTLILDELGKNGFESELANILDEGNHSVNHRNGQE